MLDSRDNCLDARLYGLMFTAVQQMLVLLQIYWVVLKESDGGTLMMFVWREILYLIHLYLREHPVFMLY